MEQVPPYMRPQKMQHLLSQFGEVTRLYLAEEDQALARRRKKAGGNKNKCFTEGWVEFEDKKVAKQVAESLNGTRIGGKKRDFYAEDLWSIKYLRHFKWAHLTEKLGAFSSPSLAVPILHPRLHCRARSVREACSRTKAALRSDGGETREC